MKAFDKLVDESKTILVIGSGSLDLDCLGSGLTLKKYFESLGKKSEFYFPRLVTEDEKSSFSYLPFFNEIIFADTSPLFKKRLFNLLILIDGPSWSQFYDGTLVEDIPDPQIYPIRIHIDHHQENGEKFGTLIIRDSQAGATAEVIISKIVPKTFFSKDTATLAYAALAGDTGNFRWNFNPKTLKFASFLLKKGANTTRIVDELFFCLSREYFETLAWVVEHADFNDEVKTTFLWLPFKIIEEEGLGRTRLALIKKVFGEEISKRIPEYPRGIVVCERAPGNIEIRARGNNLRNKINLPRLFSTLGGKYGGHFNAAGVDLRRSFKEVKEKLIYQIKTEWDK